MGELEGNEKGGPPPPVSALLRPAHTYRPITPHLFSPSHETGHYFAIDIGGTNFRVIHVDLAPTRGGVTRLEMRDAPIPDAAYTCPVDGLFDMMATTLLTFGKELGVLGAEGAPPPTIGFCFSFPCDQTALDGGRLLKLTKRFNNPGAVGVDPVVALRAALKRAGEPGARVVALLNDSVGTLAGGRYADPSVELGVILGTGTNAAYVESAAAVTKLPARAAKRLRTGRVVVNTEWGGFADASLPTLPADVALDAATPHAGEQLMEKQMSGMYMGEVARRLLVELADGGALFSAASIPKALREPGALTTADVATCDGDRSLTLTAVGRVLARVGGEGASWLDRRVVRRVCHLVARRSARLLATAVASLLCQIGRDGSGEAAAATGAAPVAVAVDGGVFEHYALYRAYVEAGLIDLLGPAAAASIALNRVRDASSRGAAFLAAAADHAELGAARAESGRLSGALSGALAAA